jgi:hypothetical protein
VPKTKVPKHSSEEKEETKASRSHSQLPHAGKTKKKSFLFLLFLFFHFDAPLLPSKEEDAPKVAGEEEPA